LVDPRGALNIRRAVVCARAWAIVATLVSAACQSEPPVETARFEGETMGTTYLVQVSEPLTQSQRILVSRMVQEALDDVNQKMSTYVPESEVSRLNQAPAGAPVRLSIDAFEVFREAARVSELTDGAFDVTVAPLVRLWGFGAGASSEPRAASDAGVDATRELVGFRNLLLDDDPPSATKRFDGIESDLSGIAKGFAVDRVAERLEKDGWTNFMVEVGGEVRTSGKNVSGDAWRIGIEKPLPGKRELQRTISLSGLSLATSGDYRNFYEQDGKLYSHLIDPRAGRPVAHTLASVSVVEHTCMRADALASGLLVLGPDAGYELAVREDLAVLFLVRTEDGRIEERGTPSFDELFGNVSMMGS
jgi:thiamine biosynthesis lipoprotein